MLLKQSKEKAARQKLREQDFVKCLAKTLNY